MNVAGFSSPPSIPNVAVQVLVFEFRDPLRPGAVEAQFDLVAVGLYELPGCFEPADETARVCVRDCTDDCGSPAYFCNYACLSSYIDEEDLTVGDACEWSPE